MVMEETSPSPQSVGREFVRQYYTLLNKNPESLHRFYSHASQFMHGDSAGGDDQLPVIGQQDIHKKIMSLSFRNCHTKIRQVDSQLSIHDSVCIQVIGELSNNGQPVRRFMQTFLLVPQTVKKYYVHNDIFRYQDEVFSDSDMDDAENQHDAEMERQDSRPVPPPAYYDHQEPAPALHSAQQPYLPRVAIPPPMEYQMPQTTPPAAQSPVKSSSASSHASVPAKSPSNVSLPPPPPAEPAYINGAAKLEAEPVETFEEAKADVETESPESKPVFSYAAAAQRAAQKQQAKARELEREDASPPKDQGFVGAPKATPPVQQQRQERPRRSERPEQEPRAPAFERAPDRVQVFAGNIPRDTNKDEIERYFEEYGAVQDVRIILNRDAESTKPIICFVTFVDEECVERCVAATHSDFRAGHRINVELKKANEEMGNRRGGFRGGFSGGRGVPRGRGGYGGRGGGGGGGGGPRY